MQNHLTECLTVNLVCLILRSTATFPPCHILRLIGFAASALPLAAALEDQWISGATTAASNAPRPELTAALGLTILSESADQECLGATASRAETATCRMHQIRAV